jgi:hypothetical protein
MRPNGMSSPEIIMNLWYVIDDLGVIYSLRARCYVHSGGDEEKLAFLRSCAETDFLIAQSFPVPERLHTTVIEGETPKKHLLPPTGHSKLLAVLGYFSRKSTRRWRNSFQRRQSSVSEVTRWFA